MRGDRVCELALAIGQLEVCLTSRRVGRLHRSEPFLLRPLAEIAVIAFHRAPHAIRACKTDIPSWLDYQMKGRLSVTYIRAQLISAVMRIIVAAAGNRWNALRPPGLRLSALVAAAPESPR